MHMIMIILFTPLTDAESFRCPANRFSSTWWTERAESSLGDQYGCKSEAWYQHEPTCVGNWLWKMKQTNHFKLVVNLEHDNRDGSVCMSILSICIIMYPIVSTFVFLMQVWHDLVCSKLVWSSVVSSFCRQHLRLFEQHLERHVRSAFFGSGRAVNLCFIRSLTSGWRTAPPIFWLTLPRRSGRKSSL